MWFIGTFDLEAGPSLADSTRLCSLNNYYFVMMCKLDMMQVLGCLDYSDHLEDAEALSLSSWSVIWTPICDQPDDDREWVDILELVA